MSNCYMCIFSIVGTEPLWNRFDEDRKSLDSKLTMVERELSHFKINETSFQQMKDMLARLKVLRSHCVLFTRY